MPACFFSTGDPRGGAPKVFILGIDGLDPRLLRQYADAGDLPNFNQLIEEGDFRPLQTTMPPLSPVAWSSFITGMDPGGHAIFDFLHRDPKSMTPEFSMSRALPSSWNLEIGSWVLPLRGGGVEQLRRGRAFWEILDEQGIPATVFRMPVNFPPAEAGRALSGMGTPDVLGTPGTFSFYTDYPPPGAGTLSGGRVFKVEIEKSRVNARLVGPDNSFRRFPKVPGGRQGEAAAPLQYEHPKLEIDFTVDLDPQLPVAKFTVQDDAFILQEGEWSEWIRIDFEAIPFLVNVSAVVRFYLQEVRPRFRLYVTPFQINPEEPVLPISNPGDWSAELQKELGYFYTQELPEDTKALTGGIFSGREFWEQSQFVFREQRKALTRLLPGFHEGLFFFYFSSVDQGCHMFWRYNDPQHPGYVDDSQLAGAIRTLYREMDEVLGEVRAALDPDTTLIVMSDHGFDPFYWGVNLNSWLAAQGYVRLINPARREGYTLFQNVDWSATEAYALGLNGLYVNLRGRERDGIIAPGTDYQELLDRLERDLLAMIDPRTGRHPVSLVIQTHRDFQGKAVEGGPDIIVGYNRGYRSSWESPLGEFPVQMFVDNKEAWSGDHSMDSRIVPGVLISNRPITVDSPALYDLTVAVLDEYGIAPTADMIGQDCLGRK